MRRVPWRLSFRYTRKGGITVFAIAMGVAFALVSFSIAQGLERDTIGIARNHAESATIIASSSGAPFAMAELASYPRAIGIITADAVDNEGRDRVAVALVGPSAPRTGEMAHAGVEDALVTRIDIGTRRVEVGAPLTHPFVAPGWFVVDAALLRADGSVVEYAILSGVTPEEAAAIHSGGFVTRGAPALELFFRASGVEIARDLVLVVAFSGALAAVFCYEFLRSEVRERRLEIGIWRAVGMRGKDVVAVFLARAAAVGAIGILAGWGMGAVLLGLVHKRTSLEILRFDIGAVEGAVISAVFMVAVLLGGVGPAFVAGRVRVQQALESRT